MKRHLHALTRSLVTDTQPGVQNAHHTWTERHSWQLSLEAKDGTRGVGEAAPLPGYSPDTLEQAHTWLTQHLTQHTWPTHQHSPAARFAIETAWLDLASKRAGQPLHRYLRGGQPATSSIPLAALLPTHLLHSHPPSDTRVIQAYSDLGITHFKLKLSGHLQKDIRRLAQLRKLAPDAHLRLDANGSFDPQQASHMLTELARYRPALIEEPTATHTIASLSPSPIPIALDESLFACASLHDIQHLIHTTKPSCLVLKPSCLGGLKRCLDIADLAASHSVQSIVSHTFGGPIEYAACAELALALTLPAPAGLAPHPGVHPDQFQHIAAYDIHQLTPHNQPGLGLGLRFQALSDLTPPSKHRATSS